MAQLSELGVAFAPIVVVQTQIYSAGALVDCDMCVTYQVEEAAGFIRRWLPIAAKRQEWLSTWRVDREVRCPPRDVE